MRILKFFLCLFLTLSLVWLLDSHHPAGSSLPPLGRLFNPFSGFWQNAEPLAMPASLTLKLPGLREEAEVIFDERLVPHIFAANLHDAIFAQGYVSAMHRLWQMDMTARSVSGKLSEVLGEVTLDRDRDMLRFGLVEAARNELKAWERVPEELALYEAYAEGVNSYVRSLSRADYPLEYKLLDYEPEAWSALHSALIMKSMALTLCFHADDLAATNTRILLGPERFDHLFPAYNPKQSPVIPEATPWAFEPIEIRADTQAVLIGELQPGPRLPMSPAFLGSNNWAVSGERTASGRPILCNDPHLSLTLPSIWYEVQIHTPELNAYGVSIPGTPGIIIGFNEDIAWGMTNVGQDVLDFYRMTWLDEAETQYLYDNRRENVRLEEERIKVRGQREAFVDTIKYTVWGPVVDRYRGQAHPGLAMRWIAHQTPEERPFYVGGVFFRLMKGKDYGDYNEALKGFDSPAQNFVFAAREGDVAIRVNGRFPVKREEQGRFIEDGSRSSNGWHGFIPPSQLPQVLNPGRGFVSSANQHSTEPSYPYYYNGHFNHYRGRYINRALEQDSLLTLEDMMALQNDNHSLLAEEALPAMLGLLDRRGLSPEEQGLIDELEQWDYRFEKNTRAPVAFVQWWEKIQEQTFDEFAAWNDSLPVLFPEDWRLIALMISDPEDEIFDQPATAEVETASDIVGAALREACAEWSRFRGDWGAYKRTTINHLARIPAFSVPVEVGGFSEAPNAVSESSGPSWRMIVELGGEVRGLGVYPGGQSGNPGSPFYDQMIDKWAGGEYCELFFMKDREDRRQPVLFSYTLK